MRYKKKDLSTRFSKDSGIKREKALEITNAFLYSFRAFLSNMRVGDSIEIRDFGVFEVHFSKGRTNARNPKTNTPHMVAAHRRLKFKPSKALRDDFKKVMM